MRFLPPRRWFQFRLSTWFVLVAILGWAMACRPFYELITKSVTVEIRWQASRPRMGLKAGRPTTSIENPGVTIENADELRPPAWAEYYQADGGTVSYSGSYYAMNSDLVWPALALAAFLAWKAAWALVERRRRRSAAPE